VGPPGLEQPRDFPRETAKVAPGGAPGGAVPADADLARIIIAWPDLPAHVRAAVLALIGTAR
jgi:hypothetical protein